MQVAKYGASSKESSQQSDLVGLSVYIEKVVTGENMAQKVERKKFKPDAIVNWQPLKGSEQMDLGKCKIRIGNRKNNQETLLLSKNLWQQSKEGEMGALTRAVAVGWEERKEKKILWGK